MKIVEICEFYSPTGGGVRTYIHQKLEAAARLGHQLTVVAPGSETRIEEKLGSRIAWVESPALPLDRSYRMFWKARDVWRVLDAEAPDLVEASSHWRGGWIAANWQGPAAKALFLHQDPVAVYAHTFLGRAIDGDRIDSMFGWFWSYLRRLSARFDASIVTGGWLAERFSRQGLSNLHVAPFGVDNDLFGPDRRCGTLRAAMLNECGLDPDASLLITVGRHHPEKQLNMLIEAVSIAQRQRAIGLYIVGDGLTHAQVRARAAKARHVHVAGRIDDRQLLSRMLASADALLHGSAAETFGFVVAEAMSSATPLIVPSAGGAGELAAPDYSETYSPGDPNRAAQAILRLLARDRTELSGAVLAAAKSRVGTTASHFEKLFELYAGLVAARRDAPGLKGAAPPYQPDTGLADDALVPEASSA